MSGETRDFLFEIGCEELPAAAARTALKQARQLALEAFARHATRIDPADLRVWITPRRITIFAAGVPLEQQPEEIAERGPRAEAAFDKNGATTKAAAGFAKAKGVDVEALEIREFEGNKFVFAVKKPETRPVSDLIVDICMQILAGLTFPKSMRWDSSGLRFSRPVRWLTVKFGDETPPGPAAYDNLPVAGSSHGHRFLFPGELAIESAGSYREQLAAAGVVVDQEERRRLILEGLATAAGKLGASFFDPAGELEEVIYLVENPSVHFGSFGEGHLRLPDKVLITAMQSHQRYFPLRDEDGSLMAGFLYVMNGDPGCAAEITEGNERVLEGRIEDAEFSYDKDLATGIEAMAASLDAVTFHRRLGSLASKTSRLWSLVESFADMVDLRAPDRKAAAAAAKIAKADLVSMMVQEFPDLQGYMGSVYAGLDGYPAEVCQAVAEQYLPVSAGGSLPSSSAGAALSVCDRVDNIVAAFSVDELPTGSRDPYGLRRSAAGLMEICRRFEFDFNLESLLSGSHRLFIEQKAEAGKDASIAGAALEFILDRLEQRLVESGKAVEIVQAARASGARSLLRIILLADALDDFRSTQAFDDFHTAYFRCSKIAAKAGESVDPASVDESLFVHGSERELYRQAAVMAPKIETLARARKYGEALELSGTIRPAVDRFFDEVLVMSEDGRVRNNRLALVLRVALLLGELGDPMMVAAAPK